MLIHKNSLSFIKKRPHNSLWIFDDSNKKLSQEDKNWIESDLGNIHE